MASVAGLYYEEHGPPDAPPLILSSGLGGSGAYWTPNLEALAASHRVILYDHRGTGRSERTLPERLSVGDMAGDLLALMNGLGIARASLMGHAAGACIALAVALDAPERVETSSWSTVSPGPTRISSAASRPAWPCCATVA